MAGTVMHTDTAHIGTARIGMADMAPVKITPRTPTRHMRDTRSLTLPTDTRLDILPWWPTAVTSPVTLTAIRLTRTLITPALSTFLTTLAITVTPRAAVANEASDAIQALPGAPGRAQDYHA